MIRRAILAAAAVVVLVLPVTFILAAVAIAHSPSEAVSGPEDPKPAPGVTFTVHASGAEPIELVTLTMTRDPEPVGSAGAPSITRQADRRGEVDFDVTLTEDGFWTLVSRTTAGVVLSTQTVTVADRGTILLADEGATGSSDSAAGASTDAQADAKPNAKPDAQPDAQPGAGGGTGGGQLGSTGFRGQGLVTIGGVLVLMGTVLILVVSPRSTAKGPA